MRARGWKPARGAWRADFGRDWLDFHAQAAQCLEYKHELARLVNAHCPDIMPATFAINDHNWPQVLNTINDLYYQQTTPSGLTWILKPSMLNNGQHIRLFQSLAELEAHFRSTDRMGGEHVLQQYLSHPHLLRDQRKYSIRMFLVLTNDAGALLYPHGYFNVALHPFAAEDCQDLKSHLTNEHLYGEAPNVIQIPAARFDFFPALYAQITLIASRVIKALRTQYPAAFVTQKLRSMAVFGVDFMVDAEGKVWLLEVNHGPCFPVSDDHPLQAYLYRDYWDALVDQIVLPLIEGQEVNRAAIFTSL